MSASMLKDTLNNIISEICENPMLFVAHPEKDFTRDRKLPLDVMLKMMLSMKGGAISREIYDYEPKNDVSSAAFVMQRDKILPEMFQYIFREFNERTAQYDKNLYKGYRLLATDGSDVNIAKDNTADTYMVKGDYNQFHINTLFDVLNKVNLDAEIQPKPQTDERRATINMIHRTKCGKAILTADRGYEGFNFFEHCRREGYEYLVRVKNGGIKEISELPMKELDREITVELRTSQTKADKQAYADGTAKYIAGKSKFGKYKKEVTWDFESPFRMTFRVVRFQISTDNHGNPVYETIITSLNRFEFPLSEIKKLYHLRWGIETSYRELKYAVGLVNFHAKKESAILQEIWARLIIYNFCERITLSVIIKQDAGRKWEYQANYTYGIHICKDYFRYHTTDPPPDVERLIEKHILPIREGRADARHIKPKSVVYFLYRVA
jgi:hypothetical protein